MQTDLQKKKMKKTIYSCMLLLALAACKKDDNKKADSQEENRISFVIADNVFNFSYFNTVLQRTGYVKKLAGVGPYTVLVPDNNAFIKAGYNTNDDILTESPAVLASIASYHIISGTWEFNKLPFTFNQEITTDAGAKMYVTHWVKNGDTVLTVNGTRILVYNRPASNGLIQVMDNVLRPLVHNTLSNAIASDTGLTFLNVALQQADLKSMLAGNDAYTVFAPNNDAFRKKGFPSADSVGATDPAVLKKMLYYTLFSGRKFIYDYILTTGDTQQSAQAMYNGNNVNITLIQSGVSFSGISLKGTGNTSIVNVVNANVMAGNGVMHVIDQVLSENQ